MTDRTLTGATANLAGAAAEDCVAAHYGRNGMKVAHRRWRGSAGEIDLVARDGDSLVFIEVKKSRSFAQAALRLGQKQMRRLCGAAAEFLANEPRGQLTDMRFDLALVNSIGAVHIIENAFGEA